MMTKKKLINIKQRIKLNNSIFYVFSQNYSIGDVKGTLLICYNEAKAKDFKEPRYDEIQNAQLLKLSNEPIKDSLKKYFTKDGKLDKKKGFQLTKTVALTKIQERILKTIDKKLLLNCSG